MRVVINWNGQHLPEELRALPPGRYVVRPLRPGGLPDDSTEENDVEATRQRLIDALREAQDDVDAGKLIPHDEMNALLAAWEMNNSPDSIWEAILASPLVEDDLSDDERIALEEGMSDIQARRVVSRDSVLETIERMRREQSD